MEVVGTHLEAQRILRSRLKVGDIFNSTLLSRIFSAKTSHSCRRIPLFKMCTLLATSRMGRSVLFLISAIAHAESAYDRRAALRATSATGIPKKIVCAAAKFAIHNAFACGFIA